MKEKVWWMGEWIGGWLGGLKAILSIAYSIKKTHFVLWAALYLGVELKLLQLKY